MNENNASVSDTGEPSERRSLGGAGAVFAPHILHMI